MKFRGGPKRRRWTLFITGKHKDSCNQITASAGENPERCWLKENWGRPLESGLAASKKHTA